MASQNYAIKLYTHLAIQYDVLTAAQHTITTDLIPGGLATRDVTICR